jgi:hypothetical protein
MVLTISGPEVFPLTHEEWTITRDNNYIGLIRKGIGDNKSVDIIFHNPEEPLNTDEMKQLTKFMEAIQNA